MEQAWAKAIALGMDDLVFWDSTPNEAGLVIKEMVQALGEREKQRAREAALITAAVYNSSVHRKPGSRTLQVRDFLREPVRVLTKKQAEQLLDGWMSSVNVEA